MTDKHLVDRLHFEEVHSADGLTLRFQKELRQLLAEAANAIKRLEAQLAEEKKRTPLPTNLRERAETAEKQLAETQAQIANCGSKTCPVRHV